MSRKLQKKRIKLGEKIDKVWLKYKRTKERRHLRKLNKTINALEKVDRALDKEVRPHNWRIIGKMVIPNYAGN